VTDYKATDYRIVGLPGAGNTSAAALFGGAQNVDWDVYWDNGAANNYLVDFNGDSTFAFSIGRGFWVIHKGALNIRTSVPSAILNVGREVEIPLHPGWNIITNPFPVAVPWDSVTRRSQVPGPIFGYTGSFSLSPVMQPYSGYYFFNGTNTQKLKVPYPTTGGTAVSVSDPVLWRVTIRLVTRGVVDSLTSFGVAEQSSDGLDELDVRKPRARGDIPTVDFRRVAWDPLYSSFASDIRKVSSSPKTWEFQVRSEPGVSARLSFCGLRRAPRDLSFYLVSEEGGSALDLRADSVFSFNPRQPVTNFSVVVGREEQVRTIVEEHLPKSFVLENNFPNPFNPSTTIAISVPEFSDVSLRIYTLLGEEVRTLFDGPLERGKYWYTWDGRTGKGNDVASGVYLYRLTTRQGTVLARTMLLLK
jgi:hypothetical protein